MDLIQSQDTIEFEVFKALGLANMAWLRSLLAPALHPASSRFVKILHEFDQAVQKRGIRSAAKEALNKFVSDIRVKNYEEMPPTGPLLILSNHPGVFDGLAILANSRRNDIKIIASGVPILRSMESADKLFIFSSLDTMERMSVIRQSIRHLRDGGTLLLFPSGGIDPDPLVMPGSLDQIATWSRSLDIFLKSVKNMKVMLSVIGGVVDKKFLRIPWIRVRRGRRNQQRISEFFQMIHHMVMNQKSENTARLFFKMLPDAEKDGCSFTREAVIEHYLHFHQECFSNPVG